MDRPTPRPHVTRTVVILLLILAAMAATAVLTLRVIDTPPDRIIRQQVPAQGYDPGLYTPFTRAPEAER